MKIKSFVVVAFLFCFTAQAAEDCPGKVDMFQGLQAQQFFYKSMNSCAVMLSPTEKGTRWRSYSFFTTGLFMIFNNLGNGSDASDTSSRSYYIFPRRGHPTYRFSRSSAVVELASGDQIFFDFKKGQISGAATPLKVKEDPRIHGQNKGGVEVLAHGGIVVDTGYFVGEVGHSVPTRFSSVIDRRGKSCRFRNDLLFSYVYGNDPYGKPQLQSVDFKFATDREFANFLRQNCPSLDVRPLLRNLTRSVARGPRKLRSKKI